MTEFVSKWHLPSGDLSLSFPVIENCTVSINWDNTQSDCCSYTNTTDISHNYPASGDYVVTVSGTTTMVLDFSLASYAARFRNQILDISQCGKGGRSDVLQLGNSGGIFKNCVSMNWSAVDDPCLNGVTNLQDLFKGAGIKGYTAAWGDFSSWDITGVVNLSGAFQDCCYNPHGIDYWVTSDVSNMANVFNNAKNFDQSLTRWDTSAVTVFTDMFKDTALFTNARPKFHSAVHSSWTLPWATDIDEIIPNSTDVSARSSYQIAPKGNGQFYLVTTSEPPPGAPASETLLINTSSIMSVTRNTSSRPNIM